MNDDWMIDAAACLKFHRKKSGLSQAELAALANVGKTAVFDIEHGKSSVQLNTFLNICTALNIKLQFSSPLMEEYHAIR